MNTLKGKVTLTLANTSLAKLTVKAFKKGKTTHQLLGTAQPDESGSFSIIHKTKSPVLKKGIDVFYEVYDGDQLLYSTESAPTKVKSADSEQVTLKIPTEKETTAVQSRESEYRVKGRIVNKDGKGIPNLTVQAYDQGVGTELLIGVHRKTNSVGQYEIVYKQENLCPGKERADLIVRVYTNDILKGASPLIVNAYEEESINIAIGEAIFRGHNEFDVLDFKLRNELSEVNLAKLTGRDAEILANKKGLNNEQVAFYIKAKVHAESTSVPAEVFYGLYRTGMPTSLNPLISQSAKRISKAIRKASKANFIGESFGNQAINFANKLQLEVGQRISLENENVRGLITTARLTDAQEKNFLSLYAAEGLAPDFWERLSRDNSFDTQSVSRLKQTVQITAISLNHQPMVTVIGGDNRIQELRDLATLGQTDWLKLIRDKETGVPANVQGKTKAIREQNYAELLARVVEDSMPTPVFANRWEKLNGGDDFTTFFKNNPSFELRDHLVSDYLQENPAALKDIADKETFSLQLASAQTLFKISPAYNKVDYVSPLIQNNVLSAHHIKLMGKQSFLNQYATPITAADYSQMYDSASQIADTSLLAVMDYIDRYDSLPAYVFPDLSSTKEEAGIPAWESLFGSLDYCECKHCHSVLSPAAYLVDLLVYLNGATAKDGETALDKLFERRSDIGEIDLTCENSLTPLPYIDLTNEILENAISPYPEVLQTELDAETLKAQPEHLRTAAYEELMANSATGETTAFPWNLPFSLWQEETHAYLGHLDVQRHDLIKLFHPTTDIQWASAYLNILPNTLSILKKTTTRSNDLKPYWGMQHPNSLRNRDIENFLQLSGLTFGELKQLVLCRFIRRHGDLTLEINNCSLDDSYIRGLKNAHLDKIHRFERLRKHLGWSIWDLDRALISIGATNINENTIILLASIHQIHQRFSRLSLAELLSWWSIHIDGWKYEDDTETLYESVFLDAAANDLDQEINGTPIRDIFALNATYDELAEVAGGRPRNIRDEGIFSLVLSAVNLTEAEYDLLINDGNELVNEELNLLNLSHLFRISSFLGNLNLKVEEYLSFKLLLSHLKGQMSFLYEDSGNITRIKQGSPSFAVEYIEVLDYLNEQKVSTEELDYLLRHAYATTSSLPMDEEEIGVLLEEIRTQLQAEESEDGLEAYLTQRLATEMEISETVMEELLTTYVKNVNDANESVMEMLTDSDFVNGEDAIEKTTFEDEYLTIELLYKISLLISQMDIPSDDLGFLFETGASFGLLDLSSLPMILDEIPTSIQRRFERWYLLHQIYDIQQRRFSEDYSIINLLELGKDSDISGISTALNEQLSWREEDVVYLLSASGLNPQFSKANWLLQLDEAYIFIDRTETSAEQLTIWAEEDVQPSHALAARNTAKAQYERKEWPDIAQELRDPLREKQRDALESYIIYTMGFVDTDDLYAHYLIDTQTNACMYTSRIKLAISAVQLFVQRIHMNLEAENQLEFTATEMEEWPWRKNYRVWEANRKVFLWPENWIEPELRDDKSPFFQKMEDILLQNAVNTQTAEQAYLSYLRDLDGVAQLEISASYYDEEADIFHVVGRTKALPHRYFYRQRVGSYYWTAWESLDLDIQGDHLMAIKYNQRLYLIWPTWEEKAEENVDLDDSEKPGTHWEIKLSWSEYKDGNWSAAVAGTSTLPSASAAPKFYYFFKPAIENNSLYVVAYYAFHHTLPSSEGGGWKVVLEAFGHFALDDCHCHGEFIGLEEVKTTNAFDDIHLPSGKSHAYMYEREGIFRETADSLNTNTSTNSVFRADEELLLTENSYRLYRPANAYNKLHKHIPFFCAGDHRTFFVTTYGRTTTIPLAEEEDDRLTFEFGEMTPGMIDWYTDAYIPDDIEVPDLDTGPLDELPPNPHGYSGNDGLHYFQGSLGENTMIVRGEETEDQLFFSPDEALSPVSQRSTHIVSRANAEFAIEGYTNLHPSEEILMEDGELHWNSFHTINAKGYKFHNFYHPYSCLFIKQLNRYGIDGLLAPNPADGQDAEDVLRQQITNDFFVDTYEPTSIVSITVPIEEIDFSTEGAYSLYNWELFFHAPLLIANRLMQNQQFEEAQKWFHYIFNPTEVEGEAPRRFWKIKPFFEYADEAQTDSLFSLLSEDSTELDAQIAIMEEDPFDPHAIAKIRKITYMKTVVMKYLDNLIAWGDYLFRQDTIESINEATQLYVLAGQILGRKPVQLEGEEAEPYTFNELFAQDLFGLSNAMIAIESQLASGEITTTGANGSSILSTMLYFCIPHNSQLLGYWETVSDRLFKIRNCQNIDGITRSLALFQPPIDPALLVKAAASGVSISSILQDLSAPLPNYRFSYMIQKANEFCNDVKSLGNALLSALEKKDAEELALIRAANEVDLLKAIKEIKKRNIDEAEEALEGLKKSKEMTETRLSFYTERESLLAEEEQQLTHLDSARMMEKLAADYQLAAGYVGYLPDFDIGISGISSPVVKARWGSSNLMAMLNAMAQNANFYGSDLRHQANMASIHAGHIRRQEEWDHQANIATQEVEQLEKQILAAEIRVEIAKKDLDSQELQIEQSQEVADFMERKYTNQELYNWMTTQISSLFFQSYNLAYEIAKQAEQCFQHELAIEDASYIEFGYYDSLKKGLLSGERLQKDLRRMEMAYLEENKREFELTKHLSLMLLNPQALIDLRATGSCEFNIPEACFDMDHPGHYLRRIKHVSLTIPCIAGPYTSVSAKLTLLKNVIRKSTDTAAGYLYTDLTDDRFTHDLLGIKSIATSNGQSDSGMFELNFRDERYLPFEGAGAISSWRLELPTEVQQFDYNSISGIVLHIQYTSRDGGDAFKDEVNTNLTASLNRSLEYLAEADVELQNLISLRQHFPNQYYELLNAAEGDEITLSVIDQHYPYYLKDKSLTLSSTTLYLKRPDQDDLEEATTELSLSDGGGATGDWMLTLDNLGDFDGDAVEDVLVLVKFGV